MTFSKLNINPADSDDRTEKVTLLSTNSRKIGNQQRIIEKYLYRLDLFTSDLIKLIMLE